MCYNDNSYFFNTKAYKSTSPTYNNIWYDNSNNSKDERMELNMTCLLAWRKDDYAIIASDSYNTLVWGETRPAYTKLFPFPEQHCIIGVAGATNFDWKERAEEEVGEIIKEKILALKTHDKEVIHTQIDSLCRQLQYHVHGDGVTQIFTALPLKLMDESNRVLDEYIEFRQFQFNKNKIIENVYDKDTEFISAALNYIPYGDKLKKELRKKPEETLKTIIRENSIIEKISQIPPRIGGKVQMWKINTKGEITDLSE